MKFSVIIPAYNSEAHIRKCLESVRSQTYTDYELIVPCDSCTDRTEEIAREYGAITIPVEYHNDGMTRNAGLDIANGDWILFSDDDDWWLHEYAFQQIADHLGDEDILCFSFIWKGVGYAWPKGNRGTLFPAVWNKCWRRSFIGETRFPWIKSVSDWKFHCAMMAKHPKIDMLDMPMYYYNYLRPGSISDELGRTVEWTRSLIKL